MMQRLALTTFAQLEGIRRAVSGAEEEWRRCWGCGIGLFGIDVGVAVYAGGGGAGEGGFGGGGAGTAGYGVFDGGEGGGGRDG